jgi:hypothetical protein
MNGKEECARETQEGFPVPFKSKDFETFHAVSKSFQSVEKTFDRLKRTNPFGFVLFFGFAA